MSVSSAAFSDDDTTVIDVQLRNGMSGIARASPMSRTPTTIATPYDVLLDRVPRRPIVCSFLSVGAQP
jgi:hypothetical protein